MAAVIRVIRAVASPLSFELPFESLSCGGPPGSGGMVLLHTCAQEARMRETKGQRRE